MLCYFMVRRKRKKTKAYYKRHPEEAADAGVIIEDSEIRRTHSRRSEGTDNRDYLKIRNKNWEYMLKLMRPDIDKRPAETYQMRPFIWYKDLGLITLFEYDQDREMVTFFPVGDSHGALRRAEIERMVKEGIFYPEPRNKYKKHTLTGALPL